MAAATAELDLVEAGAATTSSYPARVAVAISEP
jgi:hypothetical protein